MKIKTKENKSIKNWVMEITLKKKDIIKRNKKFEKKSMCKFCFNQFLPWFSVGRLGRHSDLWSELCLKDMPSVNLPPEKLTITIPNCIMMYSSSRKSDRAINTKRKPRRDERKDDEINGKTIKMCEIKGHAADFIPPFAQHTHLCLS